MGKAKWKPSELPLPRKIVNQKQYCIPGRTAEISATIKNLKDTEVVILTTSPFSFLIWPVQKTDGSWRMTVDYHKLSQFVIPIAIPVPDVMLLLEHVNMSPGTWYTAIDWANAFFSIPLKTTRMSWLSADTASNASSLSYLGVYNSPAL